MIFRSRQGAAAETLSLQSANESFKYTGNCFVSNEYEIIPGLFSVYSRVDTFMEVDHVEMKDKSEQY